MLPKVNDRPINTTRVSDLHLASQEWGGNKNFLSSENFENKFERCAL